MSAINAKMLDGKKIGLLVWYVDGQAEQAQVFTGKGRWDGKTLFLDRKRGSFEFPADWVSRIQQPLDEETRKILLGADYFVSLTIGDLPADVVESGMIPLPLKWE